jgi:putative SOS response-associated peptidase YedK
MANVKRFAMAECVEKVVGGKIPYSIGMKDNSPFVFAGLWEGWRSRDNSRQARH